MKKIALFGLVSVSAFAQLNFNNTGELHSKILSNRGRKQFRQNIISTKLNRDGLSGSNQYLEYIGKINSQYDSQDGYKYNSKTQAFLTGTVSNLKNNNDIYLGVSLGYLKSKNSNDAFHDDYKVRTYGIDYFVGKYTNDFLLFLNIGYTNSKDNHNLFKYKADNYNIGVESGYTYKFAKKSVIYPFVSINFNHYKQPSFLDVEKKNIDVGSSNIGIFLVQEITSKLSLNVSAEYSYEFDKRTSLYLKNGTSINPLKISQGTGIFNVEIGYYITQNLLLNLGYNNYLNEKYSYHMGTIGFSHNF